MSDTSRFRPFLTVMLFLSAITTASWAAPPPVPANDEFAHRRQTLIGKMDSNSVALFVGSRLARRNHDIDYPFRQNSDFYYLTGFEEPDAAFLLIPGAEKPFVVFAPAKHPMMERWIGKRAGVQGAMTEFGADTAFSIDQLAELLPQFLRGKSTLHYRRDDDRVDQMVDSLDAGVMPEQIVDLLPVVHEMRLIKSPFEISALRRAIDITCSSHIEAMKAAGPGMFEYEVEAIIEYVYRRNGSPRVGFPSIVGSGPNSTILHYDVNNRQMQKGDMIVMDIGAEYDYYSADVTRTIPVSGTFSREQRALYEIVLAAQKAGIAKAKPGAGLGDVQSAAAEVIREGLFNLGLITDKESRWQHRVWLPHGVSHWLGLDTHDAGDYARGEDGGRTLQAGMVFTVEPGIYVAKGALDVLPAMMGRFVKKEDVVAFVEAVRPVAQKYANIGIRIEDDILITEDGHEVLSARAPREIHEIEKMMQKKSPFPKS